MVKLAEKVLNKIDEADTKTLNKLAGLQLKKLKSIKRGLIKVASELDDFTRWAASEDLDTLLTPKAEDVAEKIILAAKSISDDVAQSI